VRSDEVLRHFDLLMKRKHQRKLSGAYREQAKRLREHYQFLLSYEKNTKE
jgi:hypothetical protein